MKKITQIAISLLAIIVIVPAHGEEKVRELSKEFTRPITFKFVDENEKPIDGTFTLHHTKNGKYIENWYRYEPLNADGEITINEFPPEFEFGGTSKDEFYHYWIRSADLDPVKDKYLHRCSPNGAMKFEITAFPKEYYDSLVVEYHRKLEDGSHEQVKGIGIFPDDPEHTIGGLKPGEYYIAIKFDYEDKIPIFRSTEFKVKLKEYTSLPKIEISKEAIEASDGSPNTSDDLHKERDRERNRQAREKLYDRMAANVFSVYLGIKNSDLPEKDKKIWIHQGAGAAFYYWMTTRKGGIRKSDEVERSIAMFYESAIESNMTSGFSDPLQRMALDEPWRVNVVGFSEMSQEEYKNCVGGFRSFLTDVLEERQMRQDETKERLEK